MSAPDSSSPNLDAATLRDVVRTREAALLRCYENVACPRLLPYSMRACFTIDADGSIVDADADTVNANIRSCVVGVLGTLEFPKPARGAPLEVTYELTFRTR